MRRSLIAYGILAAVLAGVLGVLWAPPAAAQQDHQQERRIVQVVIVGNEHVPEETIRGVLTHLRPGEILDPVQGNEDLVRIYELGYFLDVTSRLEPVPGTPNGVRVIIEVFELPVMEELVVTSEEVPAEVVREWMGLEEGKIIHWDTYLEALTRVRDRAREEYDVLLQPSIDDSRLFREGVLIVDWRAVRAGDIIVEGNEKTKDFVIRREARFQRGDLLRFSQLQRMTDRLMLLGIFESVAPELVPTDDETVADVLIRVRERQTGRLNLGVGYSTVDGWLGFIGLGDDNFLGRGQRAHLSWEFGQKRTTYELSFHEPYLFGTETSFEINLYNRTGERRAEGVKYTDHRAGGDLTLGRPLGEYTRGFVRYRLENWTRTPETGAETKGETRSITLSTRTDTTDSLFMPTRGLRTGLSAEFAGGWLGGTSSFTKYQGDISHYIKVGSNDQTLAVRAMYGHGHNLPEHELFSVGGSETVRGYDYDAFRGDRMAVFNVEYRFPIAVSLGGQASNLQGVVFVDAGQAFRPGEPVSLNSLKMGYGIGVRLDTFLGVIRLDYGIGEEGGKFYFSTGATF
ncbi:MAG TPA: BamA/TamA family outer membrane protein [Limnochordales bacterium]|nr:BamA/TamA family outer membrane protein [Limnochordales bacterium]